MTRLRMAVIGVGALGRHHARILSEQPDVELVAVVDQHAERGRQIANQHSTTWLPDFTPLFDQSIDAVSIVVPTVAHGDVAGEFLNRGIPVLVEKPLANSLNVAEQLVQSSNENATLLQVGHVERFNPAFQVAADYCEQPKYIRAERTAPYTFRSTDIGVVLDLMIHDLDLVLSLVKSSVRRVEAFGVGVMGGFEDAAQARVVFENGCIADFTANRVSPTVARSLQVWSAAGQVSIDLHQREVKTITPSPALRFGLSPLERSRQPGANIEQLKQDVFGKFLLTESIPVPSADALTQELQSFIHCVKTGKTPIVSGTEALAAMRVANQVMESIAAHQWDGHATGPIGAQPMSVDVVERRRAA